MLDDSSEFDYGEVFPDDWSLIIYEKDGLIFIDDQYCVTPGCGCQDVAVSFVKVYLKKSNSLGTISVDTAKWQIGNMEKASEVSDKLKQLWTDFQEIYPNLKQILRQRRKEIRKAWTTVLGQITPEAHFSKKNYKKPGRNDPCPCGSGKKYKKCCLP